MTAYSFRAECLHDVSSFIDFLNSKEIIFKIKITKATYFPDVFCLIIFPSSKKISIETLIEYMEQIDDGHIMVETLNLTREKF